MSRLLGRIGGAAATRPWRTIGAWLVILVAAVALATASGGTPHDDYNIAGSPAQAGTDFLRGHFPQLSGTSARVVIHDPAGARLDPALLTTVGDRLAQVPGGAGVEPPRLSGDGATALIGVRYRVPVTDFTGSEGVDALWAAAEPARTAGLQVELGGQVAENFSPPSGTAEAVGIVAALIILVLALGSVVAAGLPLAVALVGLGVGTSIITMLAAVTDISSTAPTIATMVGLGVGIDYALLLVSRHVEGLRLGLSAQRAAARAATTAGASVVVAGLTVLVSLFGLNLAGLPVYTSFAYATFAVVGAVMLAAVTLVPALCALAGHRLLRRAERRASRSTWTHPVAGAAVVSPNGAAVAPVRVNRTQRWAEWVGRRPVAAALVATAVLAGLAAPVLGMRTWPQDAGSQPESHTTRRAYDLVAEEFGVGANGPLVIAVDLTRVSAVDDLVSRLRAEPGVALVFPALANSAGDAAVVYVEPTTGPQDERTEQLVDRLRSQVLPEGAMVTGLVATFADISDRLAGRLWLVVAFVVGLALVLLTLLFRAPVAALKAAVLNLLSVAAAYGVITALFQSDSGARLLGLPGATSISSWVPILMFTILFGLSMDYEVFLLSRIREDYLATGEAKRSVVRGLGSTGPVITSAAAIMIAVFTGFALDPDVTVKMIGVGMAVAVLIDATLIRLVLVPAVMLLLGRVNWWLPRSLDRVLPRLTVEAAHAAEPVDPAPADVPVLSAR
ncbi:MAG TPA: MMPL family transporter [Micromonosporaceae bacterium]